MSMLKRLLSVYMMLAALVTAIHYMFTTSLFDTDFVFWGYLNWPMAIAVVIAVVASYGDKRGADAASGSGTGLRGYLDTSLLFYAAVFLFIAFFREWIVTAFAAEGDDVTLWDFIDPLFVIVTGVLGVRMWRSGS